MWEYTKEKEETWMFGYIGNGRNETKSGASIYFDKIRFIRVHVIDTVYFSTFITRMHMWISRARFNCQ